MTENSPITIVVHGTFAASSAWWKLGGDLFCDRLQSYLATWEPDGSVWQPVLDAGLTYDDFTWSGENRHCDRVEGARKIAKKLDELATKLGHNDSDPLRIRVVAHSHGGNVILEAIRYVSASVVIEKIVLLGTPLLRAWPAFRLTGLLFSFLGIAAALLGLFVAVFGLLAVPFVFLLDQLYEYRFWLLIIPAGLFGPFMLAVILMAVHSIIQLFWWLVSLPIMAFTDRVWCQAYGPSQKKLINHGCKIVSLNSPLDEAALILFMAGAVRKLVYRRLPFNAENPFVNAMLDVVLEFPEIILEWIAYGYRWHLLFYDYSVSEKSDRGYPDTVVKRKDVSDLLEKSLELSMISTAETGHRETDFFRAEAQRVHEGLDHIIEDISLIRRELDHQKDPFEYRLKYVKEFVMKQIQFRHSLYYLNDAIIEKIGDELVG